MRASENDSHRQLQDWIQASAFDMSTKDIEPSRDARSIEAVSQWYEQVKSRRVHQVSDPKRETPSTGFSFLMRLSQWLYIAGWRQVHQIPPCTPMRSEETQSVFGRGLSAATTGLDLGGCIRCDRAR
jgi:hypothetical protein